MKKISITFLSIFSVFIQGCASPVETPSSTIIKKTALISDSVKHDPSVVWAANIGGPQHHGADGILYLADELELSASRGSVSANIKGAQEFAVYQTYRSGEMHLKKPLGDGLYDIIFRFAEPTIETEIGSRVFDVLAEGRVVISKLDVKLARDGNARSSLDRAVPNVLVSDGVLDIQFASIVGEPLLNAIVVRSKAKADDDQWNLVFSDEFDYSGAPSPDKWSYNLWPPGKVNGEEQEYTDSAQNVRIKDGKLVIEAHIEGDKVTSGRIHSAGKGDLKYGRVEVRAKLPEGQGTWPAIWMLPTDPFMYASSCSSGEDWQGSSDCDAWPNSGEIDIMEHVGYDMTRVHGTVHTKSYYWVNGEQRKASIEIPTVADEFHVYAMEWSPNRIDVFVDNFLYFTYLKQSEDWQAWPFDHPFHLILNLAIGGGWGGAGGPTDKSAFPARMEIDYVRMYKRQSFATTNLNES